MSGHSASRGPSNAEVQSDLQRVAMALLTRPWITKQDSPNDFLLIKDHYEYLRDWFYDHAGYSLLVTRSFAKLEKAPGVYRTWMGIDGFHQPRDYALFTYGLWYLEGKSDTDQFLLTEMVEAIRNHLLGSNFDVDWTLYDHRLSMVRALKKMRSLGVITSIEGEETGWAREGEGANVLYEASPLARYVLRRFPKELMAYQDVNELYEVEQRAAGLVSDELLHHADVRSRRHKVFRRLLLEPVVYDWEWTEEERRYVQTQRSWILSQMGEMVGLEGRRFREGLYFHWPELMGEMDLFPTQSAVSDVVMLFAEKFREMVRERRDGVKDHREPVHERGQGLPAVPERDERLDDGAAGSTAGARYLRLWDENGCYRLTKGEFEGLLMTVRETSERFWTKDHREKSTRQLAQEILEHMVDWNLAAVDDLDGILLLPALTRFCGEYAEVVE